MVDALQQEFGSEVTWPSPRGGFFLWATLPAEIDGTLNSYWVFSLVADMARFGLDRDAFIARLVGAAAKAD